MKTTNKIIINRKFNCSTGELFDWLIQPKLIVNWFGPKHLKVGKVTTDPQVGGKYSIELLKTDGKNFFIQGEYLEIKTPIHLAFSFNYYGLAQSIPKSIVKITLEELSKDESNLSLIQKFETEPVDIENRTKSWENMFTKLSQEIKTVAK